MAVCQGSSPVGLQQASFRRPIGGIFLESGFFPLELSAEESHQVLSEQVRGPEIQNIEISQEKSKRVNSGFNKQISEEIVQIIQLHKNGTFSIYIPNS